MEKTTTHYVVVLAQQALRMGLDVDALLAEAGISADLSEAEDQCRVGIAHVERSAALIGFGVRLDKPRIPDWNSAVLGPSPVRHPAACLQLQPHCNIERRTIGTGLSTGDDFF